MPTTGWPEPYRSRTEGDDHKSTHTFVAADDIGRKVGELTAKATSDGHLTVIEWAGRWPQVQFALEDCRHVARRLEADLLRRGHQVVRVKTQLMAVHRRSSRERGKSDPIDAHAVAMAALGEPNLPIACLDGPSREVKLLSDHLHDLVCERTKHISRLRWHLHELNPKLRITLRGIRRCCVMDKLAERPAAFTGVVAPIAAELLTRCRQMTRQINDLEHQIPDRVRALAPSLLEIPGCGVLSAAVVIGETAVAHRFHSKDAYVRFNGTNSKRPGRLGVRLFDCFAGDFPIVYSVSCSPTNPPPKMQQGHRFPKLLDIEVPYVKQLRVFGSRAVAD